MSENIIQHYDVTAVNRVKSVRYLLRHIEDEHEYYILLVRRAADLVVEEYGYLNLVMLAKVGGGYIYHLDTHIWEFRRTETEARLLAADMAWFIIYRYPESRQPTDAAREETGG